MKKILSFLICSGMVCVYGTTGTLNNDSKIREFPSMKSKVVATRKKGRSFEIIQKVDTPTQGVWYQTPKGYIYEKFITIDEDISPLKEEVKTEDQIKDEPTLKTNILVEQPIQIEPEFIPPIIAVEPLATTSLPLATINHEEKAIIQTQDNLVSNKDVIKTELIVQDTNQIKELTPLTQKEEILNEYSTALKLYKKNEYKEAYTILNQLFEKNLNDPNIDFYLGRSAFEVGLYDEAVLAFDRLLFDKPETLRVQFELGRVYIGKEDYLSAKKYFTGIVENPKTPEDLLQVSKKYLTVVEEKISKHKVGGVLMVGVNYDSNYGSQDADNTWEYIKKYDPSASKPDVADENVLFHQEVGLINYLYKVSDTNNLKLDFMAFNKQSFDKKTKDKDVQLVSVTPALNVNYNERLSVDYALYGDLLKLNYQSYLKTVALVPKINYVMNQTNTLEGYIKYQSKFHQQQNDKKNDSNYIELNGKWSHIYSDKITFLPSITLMNERVKDKSTTGVDYSGVELVFATNYTYLPVWILSPSVTYNYSNYDDFDTIQTTIKEKRNNTKFAFSSTYVYSPKFIINGNFDYTMQNSNIIKNEYDKYTFGINLIRPF